MVLEYFAKLNKTPERNNKVGSADWYGHRIASMLDGQSKYMEQGVLNPTI